MGSRPSDRVDCTAGPGAVVRRVALPVAAVDVSRFPRTRSIRRWHQERPPAPGNVLLTGRRRLSEPLQACAKLDSMNALEKTRLYAVRSGTGGNFETGIVVELDPNVPAGTPVLFQVTGANYADQAGTDGRRWRGSFSFSDVGASCCRSPVFLHCRSERGQRPRVMTSLPRSPQQLPKPPKPPKPPGRLPVGSYLATTRYSFAPRPAWTLRSRRPSRSIPERSLRQWQRPR